jgi:hypothetical protein
MPARDVLRGENMDMIEDPTLANMPPGDVPRGEHGDVTDSLTYRGRSSHVPAFDVFENTGDMFSFLSECGILGTFFLLEAANFCSDKRVCSCVVRRALRRRGVDVDVLRSGSGDFTSVTEEYNRGIG